MAKPAGPACNLACAYCYYLGKESLYPGSRLRMTDDVLEAYLVQLLTSQDGPEVSVSWQGGEPTLMGLDFFRRSVELVRRHRRPGQRVSYALQTNGTRLDQAWCAFFKEHGFLVGLSLDGPPALHDAYRLDRSGRGTYRRARRGWDLLQKHAVEANILCAVHAANAAHPLEVYRFFRDDLQARFIQFIPVVERPAVENPVAEDDGTPPSGAARTTGKPEERRVGPRSVGSEQFGDFLIEIFDEWVRRDVGTVFVQAFDSALASWCGLPSSVCVFQETCGASLVLEHNGDLYACDHFVDSGHRLGNILETPMDELAASPRQWDFGLAKRDLLPARCRACDVLFACHGECPRNRLPGGGGDEDGLNYLCAGYQRFFRHIDRPMRIMADLLRQGRAPAEVMRTRPTDA
jgi:serine-type anaerobic sulfatase-maturating enzyme